MQRTQEPVDVSQSIPSGVQVRSDMHFVRQLFATQVSVASRQSASDRHATQRPVAALQTWAVGQSSELAQVVYGTHFLAVQSLFAGQSLAVTQSTHWAIAGSQTCSPEQSRLLRQLAGIPLSAVCCFLLLPHPGAPRATARIATAQAKKERL
jgi:hypothetical protein